MKSPSLLITIILFYHLCLLEGKQIPSDYKHALGATLPGMYTTISQTGLNYFATVGLQRMEDKIKTITIPDQSGEADTTIGKVDWTLTSIKVSSLSVQKAEIQTVDGKGLNFIISGLNLDFSANWHYKKKHWPHVSDHGTATIHVQGATITVGLLVTAKSGAAHVAVTSDSVQISKLDIKMHGGASWLYNFFLHILSGNVRKLIEKQLQTTISTNVDQGVNGALATLPMNTMVNKDTELSFELVSNPITTSSYFSLPQLGEFYDVNNKVECPAANCPADKSLPQSIQKKMMQIIIGDFLANSGGFVFWKEKQLDIQVTDSEVPSNAPIRLNTTYWKYLVPEMVAMYPNNLMQLHVYASSSPVVSFSPNGATVSLEGIIEVFIILSNGTLAPGFTLTGSVTSRALAFLNGQKMYANVTFEAASFKVASSSVGDVNASLLNNLVTLFIQMGVIPAVNDELAQGFLLPTIKGMTLVDAELVWGNQYVAVASNIQYNPPALSFVTPIIVV